MAEPSPRPAAGSTEQRLAALFARSTTSVLIESLLALDAGLASQECNWARAKTIDELERRYPRAAQAVQDAFDTAEETIEQGHAPATVDYVAVLVAAITAETRSPTR